MTNVVKDVEATISVDRRGRCMENIFIERLWRSPKYGSAHLHELTDGFHAEQIIGGWIDFYNAERRHSSLGYRMPKEGSRRRLTCGYDGQGSRLTHIPTGSTTAGRHDKQIAGSVTPFEKPASAGVGKSASGTHLNLAARLCANGWNHLNQNHRRLWTETRVCYGRMSGWAHGHPGARGKHTVEYP